MIATNEAADVLRHGWRDAVGTLAPEIPEVAELLQARLEIAIASQRLDERHLLETIEEVESISSRAGSPASDALARRLRRTVYEYLLALDAARPTEKGAADVASPAPPAGPMVGAEEVAALGNGLRYHAGEEPEAQAHVTAGTAAAGSSAEAPAPRRRFGLWLRRRHSAGDPATERSLDALLDDDSVLTDERAARPHWQFASSENGTVVDAEAGAEAAAAEAAAAEAAAAEAAAAEAAAAEAAAAEAAAAEAAAAEAAAAEAAAAEAAAEAAAAEAAAAEAAAAEAAAAEAAAAEAAAAEAAAAEAAAHAATEPEPLPQVSAGEPIDPAAPTFVAPKEGFHIVDERTSPPVFSLNNDTPMTMPAFAADEQAAAEASDPATGSPSGGDGNADAEFVPYNRRREDVADAPSATEPGQPDASASPAVPAAAAPPAAAPAPAPDAESAPAASAVAPSAAAEAAAPQEVDAPPEGGQGHRGWSVRRQSRPGRPVPAVEIEDDPFQTNLQLADTRRRIEDRLRRRRCDEAAALLQELSRETGGRAVAELAMNAGDRCRALGKSNAALNCYLAAARSDPVFELPLSRLADICIDDKETDLAVSYLERIARLYRFRGDDKEAMRVYRRIATIAPYREDILALLLKANRSGGFDA